MWDGDEFAGALGRRPARSIMDDGFAVKAVVLALAMALEGIWFLNRESWNEGVSLYNEGCLISCSWIYLYNHVQLYGPPVKTWSVDEGLRLEQFYLTEMRGLPVNCTEFVFAGPIYLISLL